MLVVVLVLLWASCSLPLLATTCPTLHHSLVTSDLVLETSLVSRSRVQHGQYYATFRIEKMLSSKDSDLNSKYLRLKLETKSRQSREDTRCNFTTKVKPNNKYLLMVKKDTKSKAGGRS